LILERRNKMRRKEYDFKEVCKCGASFELNLYDEEAKEIFERWQKNHKTHHIQQIMYDPDKIKIGNLSDGIIEVTLKRDK